MIICDPMVFGEFDDSGMVNGGFECKDMIIGLNGYRYW
jgi:hypothetical protein